MYQQIGAIPDWVKRLGASIVRGTIVSVPTPAGPVTVDLGNPDSLARLKAVLAGTKITTQVGTPAPTPAQQVNAAVSNVPGGWMTMVLAAGAALFLLPRMLRSR